LVIKTLDPDPDSLEMPDPYPDSDSVHNTGPIVPETIVHKICFQSYTRVHVLSLTLDLSIEFESSYFFVLKKVLFLVPTIESFLAVPFRA
jgi:hypothetical protein